MNKELIQDIRQPKRRLAEILPVGGRGSIAASASSVRRPRRGRTTGWLIVVILIIALPLAYFVSQSFAAVVVTVKPKQAILTLNDTLPAIALPADTGISDPETKVGYETMTIQATDSAAVAATEKETAALRASGEILVSNRYSSRPQKLIANTRFETANGKIYRIKDEIMVPGYELVDGKLTPGELAVTVYADKPGAEYNGEVENLLIPGFKGEARYDKITARGLETMAGGFAGERLTVSPSAKEAAEKELRSRLERSLTEEARLALPDGFVTFPETRFVKFQSRVKDELVGSGNLKLELDGELTMFIFSRRELSRHLAARRLTDYDGAEVEVANFDELEFSLLNRDAAFVPTASRKISVNFTGEARLIWQFELMALKSALAGVNKSDYQAVFLKFPGIAAAEVTTQPPWLKRFPVDHDKITVRVDQ